MNVNKMYRSDMAQPSLTSRSSNVIACRKFSRVGGNTPSPSRASDSTNCATDHQKLRTGDIVTASRDAEHSEADEEYPHRSGLGNAYGLANARSTAGTGPN